MRIFVAGATGYLGSGLVRAALAAGHQVTGLARTPEAAAKLRAAGAAVHDGDLTRPDSLRGLAEEHDALVHAAAVPKGPDRPAVDRAATFALIDAARATGAPRSVIYTSGIWTLGATNGVPAGEDASVDHPADVSMFRPALERDVMTATGGGLACAVVRPGMVYGGTDGVIHALASWFPEEAGRAGEIVTIDEGANRWPVIHVDDLARLYLLIAERRARGMFHVVEPEPVRVSDIATRLAALSDRKLSSWPLAEARAKLGPIAVAYALDQHVIAPRTERELGWRPGRRFDVASAWREHG